MFRILVRGIHPFDRYVPDPDVEGRRLAERMPTPGSDMYIDGGNGPRGSPQ